MHFQGGNDSWNTATYIWGDRTIHRSLQKIRRSFDDQLIMIYVIHQNQQKNI